MFFGTFNVINNPFFDENDNNNFLKQQMNKGLSFRINIIPDVIYQKGVTEHQYLDSLNGINNVSDMWNISEIDRKFTKIPIKLKEKELNAYDTLKACLSKEDFKIFEDFLELYGERKDFELEEKYIQGFKTGILIGIECSKLKL